MPLVTFKQQDRLGEIVLNSPPQNLYSAELLADLRAAVDEAAGSDIRALLPKELHKLPLLTETGIIYK